MTYEVNTKPSKSGKETMYFVTVNGKRVSSTNYRRRWEAVNFFKSLLKAVGEEKLTAWANS